MLEREIVGGGAARPAGTMIDAGGAGEPSAGTSMCDSRAIRRSDSSCYALQWNHEHRVNDGAKDCRGGVPL
jgi:hypothetical protein